MSMLAHILALVAAASAAFLAGSLLPEGVEGLHRWFTDAPRADPLQDRKLLALGAAAASVVLVFACGAWALPLCLLADIMALIFVPRLHRKRQQEAVRELWESQADMLADIVSLGVDAGLSFDRALDLYCGKFSGPVSQRLKVAHSQWACGINTREGALLEIASETDSPAMRRFADMSAQAVEKGARLAPMLQRLATDVRSKRRAQVEQQIAKAPVKMLLPTGLLILPAALVLVMGPAILQFASSSV